MLFSSSSLTEVVLSPQITSCETAVFHLNDYIKEIVISCNISSTSEKMIWSLPNLVIVYFSEGVETICQNTIIDCPRLKSIHFPYSLKDVQSNAFSLISPYYVTYPKALYQQLLNGGLSKRALTQMTGCIQVRIIRLPQFVFLFFLSEQ